MANEELIQPLNPSAAVAPAEEIVTPAEPTAPEAPTAPEGAPGLPEELLKIPALQAVVAGAPPAVSATIADFQKRPEGKALAANKDGMIKAGLGMYRSLGGDLGVIFNRFYLSGEELQAADKAGKLSEIALPFEQVNTTVKKAGLNNPSFNNAGPSGVYKNAPVPAVPQASTTLPSETSAGAQRRALSAKIKNSQQQGPLSGPSPGSGELLRSILKPVLGLVLTAFSTIFVFGQAILT